MTRFLAARKKEVTITLLIVFISTCLWLGLGMRSTEEPHPVPMGLPPIDERSLGHHLTLNEVKEKASFPVLVPTYVPGDAKLEEIRGFGFEEVDSYCEFRFYYSDKDLAFYINPSYGELTSDDIQCWVDDLQEYRRLIEIDGSPGMTQEDFINSAGQHVPTYLELYNNDLGVQITIRGFLPPEELIKMAKSLEPLNSL